MSESKKSEKKAATAAATTTATTAAAAAADSRPSSTKAGTVPAGRWALSDYRRVSFGPKRGDSALDKMLDDLIDKLFPGFKKIEGRYKMEIFFGTDKSMTKPFTGIIAIWRKARYFGEWAQELVAFCPRCHQPLLPDSYTVKPVKVGGKVEAKRVAICHNCGGQWVDDQLEQLYIGKMPASKWADFIVHFWKVLGGDVDLQLKRHRRDLVPLYSQLRHDRLSEHLRHQMDTQATDYDVVVYPLSRITADSANVQDIRKLVLNFINA